MSFEERKLLGEYLVEKKIITKKQLQQAIDEHKRTNQRLGDIIVKNGWAKEEEVVKALSEQLGFAFIDVATYHFDQASVNLISENIARKLKTIPIYQIANTLTVAMVDPLNVGAIDELETVTSLNINPVFATATGINDAIEKYYRRTNKEESSSSEKPSEKKKDKTSAKAKEENDEAPSLIEEATQAPVIKLVNKIISDAVNLGASDIHLEPQNKTFYCRYRVDGVLQKFITLPEDLQLAVVSRVKIMSGIDITERRLPQDGRIEITIEGKEVDLRVATFPTIYGEHVAIRLLDKSKGILRLEELGFNGELLSSFQEVISKPHGIILVTGPTGSGKSTTLYSVLNTIRDAQKNIITLEDPVEYGVENVHQSQVNVKAGLTFSTGLRSIVRLDPDIIMIGEIRDKETAEIATQSALTGHLVFSTLHTNDSASAFTRLIDIGLEPFLISSSVRAVLAQRLIRQLCEKCKEEYKPSTDELGRLNLKSGILSGKFSFYKPVGCEACDHTGFIGRTAIYELLVPTDKIKELVIQKASANVIAEETRKAGMKTLLEDGLEKVKTGVTSLSEILRVTEAI